MTTSQCVLFFDMCRLCLDKKGVSVICEQNDLPRHIKRCTGVSVRPSDNLPQKICMNCFQIIQRAVELRKIAKLNDSNLKSLFDDDVESITLEALSSSSDTALSHDESHEENAVQYRRDADDYPKIHVRKDLYEGCSTLKVANENNINCEKELRVKSNSVTVGENTENSDRSSHRGSSPNPTCKKKRFKLENSFIEEMECDICHKTYETSKKLYLHRRSHNKKISCPLDACGKFFATKGDLQKHIRTHTGERPFECDICNKKFTQQVTLKTHKNTVHFEVS